MSLEVITVNNGSNEYPGNFTSEEIEIIKNNTTGNILNLFSGKSDIGNIRIDYKFGVIKEDVFEFLYYNTLHFDTIIIDAPYNQKFADTYQKIGNTEKQFIIFANAKKTTLLWDYIKKLKPEIIILKSWNYYIPKGYKLKKGYLCYAGGYRKPTLLLIMEREASPK